jgi:hypothetical protein
MAQVEHAVRAASVLITHLRTNGETSMLDHVSDHFISRRTRSTNKKHGRCRLEIEDLESRQLMAADMMAQRVRVGRDVLRIPVIVLKVAERGVGAEESSSQAGVIHNHTGNNICHAFVCCAVDHAESDAKLLIQPVVWQLMMR